MRNMKESGIEWIGEIPETWSRCEIKFYCEDIFPGATPQSSNPDYWDGEINWIPSGSCHDCIITKAPKKITQAGYENSSTKLIPANTALVAMTGATCGNTGYLTMKSCANQSVAAFVEDKSRCNSVFLWYILRAAKEHLLTFQSGGAQGGVNIENCKNIFVPFVPLDEQLRIGAFLDRRCAEIDSVIMETEKTIAEYKALKQSIITEAVTHSVRGNRPMKESGIEWIGKIPEEWTPTRFKYVAQVKANLVTPDEYGDYPQVSPENIEKGTGKLLPCRTVSEVGVISGNHLFYKGQILYSKIRPKLNKATIAPFDGLCSADVYPIETSLNKYFLLYAMLSDVLLSQVSMITEDRVKMPKINQDELGNTWFAIPPIEEQEEIVDYLNSKCREIDQLIIAKQQFLLELEGYKKSVIYEYVTGKKEAPVCQ